MVKPDAAETFWQRFWATYQFRRNFGRENWALILGRDPRSLAQRFEKVITDSQRRGAEEGWGREREC
jgi:hypothetical protein